MIAEFVSNAGVLVCAPAGCGKTSLLVEAVKNLEGRQLVLTHTNAGVRELSQRLNREGVERSKYNLKTIDAFAFGFVAAYPSSAGVVIDEGEWTQWGEIKEGFLRLLSFQFIKSIIGASYTGVLVDEYQDCSVVQHEIVVALSNLLPTRIVGDPMQGIFNFGHDREAAVPWTNVESSFRLLGTLEVPHRWQITNPGLGAWILSSRLRLEGGQGIRNSSEIVFHNDSNRRSLLGKLHELADNHPNDSIAVIFPSLRASCWKLASTLRNRYEVVEDAECVDLLEACAILDRAIESRDGPNATRQISKIVRNCAAKLPTQLPSWTEKVASGVPVSTRSPALRGVLEALIDVNTLTSYEAVRRFYLECGSTRGLVFKSREMWTTLGKALNLQTARDNLSIVQAVRQIRREDKVHGRRPPRRCISTTLLLKGLEFDRVVIADFSAYRSLPKHLYVALSRAKLSLDIFRMADRSPRSRS